jgi:LytS/YehU family sensor histidine kinase
MFKDIKWSAVFVGLIVARFIALLGGRLDKIGSIVVELLAYIVAGYVAATLAKKAEVNNALMVGVCSLLLYLIALPILWLVISFHVPTLQTIIRLGLIGFLLALATIPLAGAGGYLRQLTGGSKRTNGSFE